MLHLKGNGGIDKIKLMKLFPFCFNTVIAIEWASKISLSSCLLESNLLNRCCLFSIPLQIWNAWKSENSLSKLWLSKEIFLRIIPFAYSPFNVSTMSFLKGFSCLKSLFVFSEMVYVFFSFSILPAFNLFETMSKARHWYAVNFEITKFKTYSSIFSGKL